MVNQDKDCLFVGR